jgi:hypothetical protein
MFLLELPGETSMGNIKLKWTGLFIKGLPKIQYPNDIWYLFVCFTLAKYFLFTGFFFFVALGFELRASPRQALYHLSQTVNPLFTGFYF